MGWLSLLKRHKSMITKFEDLDLTKQYSYADYLTWQFQERLELIKGYIFPMSAPARRHQQISWNLTTSFVDYFRNNPYKVYLAPFDVRLPRTPTAENKKVMTVLQPDLCVICDLTKLDDKGCVGAPDLVVEILSPGNTKKEMKQKFDAYQDAGVTEYWIIQTDDRNVFQYVLNNEGIYIGLHPLTDEDELVSRVFPDFKIDLATVFAD
jgi:Uma2 family endonuclease